MSAARDHTDAFRQQNLATIGRTLPLPAAPTAERVARWRAAADAAAIPAADPRRVWPLRRLALVTSGIAASALLAAFWISVQAVAPVSAATVLTQFKQALRQGLTIRLEAIDLGSVGIDGQVIVSRPAGGAPSRYSELHATVKSDNPEFPDWPAASVFYEGPEQAWWFMRGSGGSVWKDEVFVVVEDLYLGRRWVENLADRDPFGSVPMGLGFSGEGGQVQYTFTTPQRRMVNALLKFLQELSTPESAAGLVDELAAHAAHVAMRPGGDGLWVLEAGGFHTLWLLDELEVEPPPIRSLLETITLELQFDEQRRIVTGVTTWKGSGAETLGSFGIHIEHLPTLRQLAAESETVEDLADLLRECANTVEVERGLLSELGVGRPKVRVTGYPWPVDTSGLDWARAAAQHLRENLQLAVGYDAQVGAVRWAELRNIAAAGGTIHMDMGDARITAAQSDPQRWVTENTIVHDQ